MKKLLVISLMILSTITYAKQVLVVHYLGDTRPLTIEVPLIVNKGGTQTTLENSKLTFNFDSATTLGLNADFNVIVEGNNISIEGTSINKSIINIETNKVDEKNYTAMVKFISPEEIMSPLKNGVTEPEIKNNIMTFVTGNLSNQDLYSLKLKITKKRFLKSDDVLADRILKTEEYTTEILSDNKTKVSIDLKKITDNNFGINNKYEINITMALTYNFKNVVNLKQLGPIIVDRSLKYQNN